MRTRPDLLWPVETDDPPRAAMRDASWLNRPGTAYVYHVATTHMSACCFRDQPLAESTALPAAQVPPSQRCGRPACRKRWPDYEGNP